MAWVRRRPNKTGLLQSTAFLGLEHGRGSGLESGFQWGLKIEFIGPFLFCCVMGFPYRNWSPAVGKNSLKVGRTRSAIRDSTYRIWPPAVPNNESKSDRRSLQNQGFTYRIWPAAVSKNDRKVTKSGSRIREIRARIWPPAVLKITKK